MSKLPDESHKHELQSTYLVQNRQSQDEMARVTVQDQMLTASMGGVLPEQLDPTIFHRVLDVGCGTGGWAIEAAKTYPTMSLVGVDISGIMIDYARKRAEVEQVADRTEFHVMDALRMLEFPPAYFDLVNLRLGTSFLRTWDWPKLLSEFQRVSRYGGIIRITEADSVESNSPALELRQSVLVQAFYHSGRFFTPTRDSNTSQLASLLTRHGLTDVQTRTHTLKYRGGTPEGQLFAEDMLRGFQTMRPFFQRWTRLPDDYDTAYEQARIELQQPDFEAIRPSVTAWGRVTTRWQAGPADKR